MKTTKGAASPVAFTVVVARAPKIESGRRHRGTLRAFWARLLSVFLFAALTPGLTEPLESLISTAIDEVCCDEPCEDAQGECCPKDCADCACCLHLSALAAPIAPAPAEPLEEPSAVSSPAQGEHPSGYPTPPFRPPAV